jgi:hypothetical protein
MNEPRQAIVTISHATIGGVIALPSPGRHRERRAFTDAHQEPAEEQRGQAAGKSRQDRRGGPDEAAQEQRPARTEAVADPAAEDLENQVRVAERRLQKTKLGVGERELPLDRVGGRRDVYAIDIRDEVHHAQQAQDDGGRLRPLDEGHLRGYRLQQ